MNVAFVCLLFVIGKVTAGDDCSKGKDLTVEAQLRRKVFCNYDKNVRPVKHFDNQTNVEFQLFPTNIFLNAYYHSFLLKGSVFYLWLDEFLQWDPKEYEGIDFLLIKNHEIWQPDVTSDSEDEDSTSTFTEWSDCKLFHTGYVYCFYHGTFYIPCLPDVTFHPKDVLNCSVEFSSIGFTGEHINLTIHNPNAPIDVRLYTPNKDWELNTLITQREVKHLLVENETSWYPIIRCTFILGRHSAREFTAVVFPAAVLAGLTLLIFWMDSMYSIRLAIAGVVMISDVLYLTYLGTNLSPNGDKAPVIMIFLRDSFVIASFTIIVTTIVRNIRMKTEQPSNRLTDLLAKMEFISCVGSAFLGENSLKSEDTEEVTENAKNNPTAWDQLAIVIDRTSFVFCCLTYVILLTFYLP